MDDIADRAARVTARHPAPALPFQEVGRLVRGSGVAVTDEILLRTLARDSGRFRIVDPWRGPWRGTSGRRVGTADSCGSDSPLGPCEHLPPGPWVVPDRGPTPWSPYGRRLALRRLRECLVHLGWALDTRSTRAIARWCVLVGEGSRVRRELSRGSPP